jgi:hypothetical protein
MLQHLKHIHLVSIFQNISLFNTIIIILKHKTVVVGTLKCFCVCSNLSNQPFEILKDFLKDFSTLLGSFASCIKNDSQWIVTFLISISCVKAPSWLLTYSKHWNKKGQSKGWFDCDCTQSYTKCKDVVGEKSKQWSNSSS